MLQEKQMFSLCFNLLNRSMPGQAKSKVDVRSGGQRQHRSTGVAEAAAWVLVTPLRNCSLSVRYSLGSRDLRDINQISASFVAFCGCRDLCFVARSALVTTLNSRMCHVWHCAPVRSDAGPFVSQQEGTHRVLLASQR